VNPETGAEKTMVAVPSDDVLSYRYGYASEGTSKISSFISPFATDPSRPVMIMLLALVLAALVAAWLDL
jgi:hypothetical protein